MPEFTRDEHDDMVFPELYAKRQFVPGTRVALTIRNRSPMHCGPFAHECPLSIVLRGEIMRRPLWADEDSIALFVSHQESPNRLIRLRDIEAVNGRPFRFGRGVEVEPAQVWRVQGSGNNVYTVEHDNGTWSCTCPGNKYHGHCKHVAAKQADTAAGKT